jgi:putative hydrolase of the HAD superfamily
MEQDFLKDVKWIFFDCMDTLVDVIGKPLLRDYAWWAYNGANVDKYWDNFEDFFLCYSRAKEVLAGKLPEFKEYEISLRFEECCKQKAMNANEIKNTVNILHRNFWKTYRAKCYIRNDVISMLQILEGHYKMGVVSNFMVMDGIEELLETNRIIKYFNFVVTSVKEGWRKPDGRIFESSLKKAGVKPHEVLFIGDDYINDYLGAKDAGMKCVLIDTGCQGDGVSDTHLGVTNPVPLTTLTKNILQSIIKP